MKINYQHKLDGILAELSCEDRRPSLLLHSCCAPCSSYVLEYLAAHFKITVFYYNPNIDPEEEYRKRAAEQRRFLSVFGAGAPGFIEGPYEPENFRRLSEGLENEREGGRRRHRCYELRLRKTAALAKEKGFDYFTTTLSVSPHKDAQKLNEIGGALAGEYGVPYLYADFKKKNGYLRSIALSREHGLYRQDYCGCLYSRLQRLAEKAEKGPDAPG